MSHFATCFCWFNMYPENQLWGNVTLTFYVKFNFKITVQIHICLNNHISQNAVDIDRFPNLFNHSEQNVTKTFKVNDQGHSAKGHSANLTCKRSATL